MLLLAPPLNCEQHSALTENSVPRRKPLTRNMRLRETSRSSSGRGPLIGALYYAHAAAALSRRSAAALEEALKPAGIQYPDMVKHVGLPDTPTGKPALEFSKALRVLPLASQLFSLPQDIMAWQKRCGYPHRQASPGVFKIKRPLLAGGCGVVATNEDPPPETEASNQQRTPASHARPPPPVYCRHSRPTAMAVSSPCFSFLVCPGLASLLICIAGVGLHLLTVLLHRLAPK
jgi:hypothetical protein